MNLNTNLKILWDQFFIRNNLSFEQSEQFKLYYEILKKYNKLHNLTAITDFELIISDHFDDSLALCSAIDCKKINSIADVGAGAGFPGIALKIKNPHLSVVLIEVIKKKVNFLALVIDSLKLKNVEIYDLDWRTFLRKTNYSIDVFCARASLQPEELIRIFKPASPYKNAQLVYWASKNWEAPKSVSSFISNEYWYMIGNKKRKLVFFNK